uniref:Anti-proliferative protein domain-containing protein n=1 Tax=Clytia hemisphaerica TaxID=252671 RepID=A0A7M5WT43_9CNID|eukprot:TCONS_00033335-protein
MLKEVQSGVQFVTDFLSRNDIIPQPKIDQFSTILEKLLFNKYNNHWFPKKPLQGSGFRCIRITQTIMDPEIEKAARLSGVSAFDLTNTLPKEFTMWIDPEDVSYRIGEDGSICTLESDLKVQSSPSLIRRCQTEVNKKDLIDPPAFQQCLS